MEPTLENCISSLLVRLKDERLSGISQLLESGSWILPLTTLKECKQNVQDLATSASDLFLYAAVLYYAKFIQSIEVVNLVYEYTLIPQYLKIIDVMKTLCEKIGLGEVHLENYLRIIIECIKEILLSYERIEKTFESLNILKTIENDFGISILGQKEEYEFVDLGIQEYVENEEDLIKSYLIIKKIKEGWRFDLFYSEGSWVAKARRCLEEENQETCDKSRIKDILILLYSFKNEYYPEIEEEVVHFCEEKFAIEPGDILNSEQLLSSNVELALNATVFCSEFSPIFENNCIRHISQFKSRNPPIYKMPQGHITIREGISLLNLTNICVKEYNGSDPDVLKQFRNEVKIGQKLSEIGSPLYLRHFSNFEDSENHYIIMELCKIELRRLISSNFNFNKNDLAHFAYSFIKGLSELKNKQKIYHRDIKPENIMVGYDNEFKLIDFNISIEFESDSEIVGIGSHSKRGTLNYSSPEKYHCPQELKKHKHSRELNDVYSLGLVILEMHTLETIAGYRSNEELFLQKQNEQISSIKITWLADLLREMLTYDYNGRPRFGNLRETIEKNSEFMNDKQNKDRNIFKI